VGLYEPGSEIDLSGNTWFSSDPARIRAAILDAKDDPALGASVIFEPLSGGGVPVQSATFGKVKALFR
jgi:hypothetical protein